ncbi:MAG: hypothetical protein GWN07_02780 [Actinobacteria bacterium]|nr:hypothetical protein [Actinomycetota bacterium]NIU64431.1 hypothetical protein [Actinomycetota bacterium]NIW26234.1 hypothetical protein [Actinomycetota bacterium]NIX18815.1 hypothetical protein [Actinomycetota bacterium]
MSGHALHRRLLPMAPAGALTRARSAARALAFWLAVALPLAYLPAVLLSPGALADPGLVVAAVAGNLAAIVVGHGHEPGR